ncbi:hypothetical protein H2200_007747 [Cladophialophora chaetospira]|uniref:DUF8212 domain-containing protein n=1 Tax=Cladophialophora chaetospira TaxID=386627 RepID=A0AA38X6I1_9EURO|nr:hypothetical protein H2200_007747 [Cladophialophora chaetospira]
MFMWYQDASICYVYLSDVSISDDAGAGESLQKARWFTRGWTLLELLAPSVVTFLDRQWNEVGTKLSLQTIVSTITTIPTEYLLGKKLSNASIAQRMSWASRRTTTKVEDQAYCLLGIFDVNMPLIYGEGVKSFRRLQEEIIKVSDDQSILAWGSEDAGDITYVGPPKSLFADSPSRFASSGNVVSDQNQFDFDKPSTLTRKGIRLSLPVMEVTENKFLAILRCSINGQKVSITVEPMLSDSGNSVGHYVRTTDLITVLKPGSHRDNPRRRECVFLTDLVNYRVLKQSRTQHLNADSDYSSERAKTLRPSDGTEVSDSGYGSLKDPDLDTKPGIHHQIGKFEQDVNEPGDLQEIESLISDLEDIGSLRRTTRIPEVIQAERRLQDVLVSNEELLLTLAGIPEMVGEGRLRDNLRRILKKLYLDLRESAMSSLERSTASLLRSRKTRLSFASAIIRKMTGTEEVVAEDDDETNLRQPYRKSDADLEDWISKNAAYSDSSTDVDTMRDNLQGHDTETDDEEEESEDDQFREFPNVSRMVDFVVKGSAFRNLLINVRLFAIPRQYSSLKRILTTMNDDRVAFSCYVHQEWSDKMRCYFERISEMRFNWWPLDRPQSALQHGLVRIAWTCHCGQRLHEDIPPQPAFQFYQVIQRRSAPLNIDHLCLNRKRQPHNFSGIVTSLCYRAQIVVKSLPAFTRAAQTPSGAQDVQSRTSSATTQRAGHHHLPGTSSNAASLNTGDSSIPKVSATQNSQRDHVVQMEPDNQLRVLLGVHGRRITLEVHQMNIKKTKSDGRPADDGDFFSDLVRSYKLIRGRLRLWLSIWQFQYCNFRKLKKIRKNRIVVGEPAIPSDPDYEYDNSPTPPSEMPPISEHEFRTSLFPCPPNCCLSSFHHCIEPLTEHSALKLIPKKKSPWQIDCAGRDQAYSLETVYEISVLHLVLYHILMVAGTFGFWAWWQKMHPDDVSGAGVPLTLIVALLSLFGTAAGILKIFKATEQ